MTGICGAFRGAGGSCEPDALAGMLEVYRSQFDAESAIFQGADGGLVMAQHLHAQVPEAVGLKGCVTWPERDLAIVADMRLDDRGGLIDALGLGTRAQSWPDEALVLRAHGRWGPDCPEHLLGDFAYALWDGRAGELHLVRDAMGARPLVFAHQGETVAFASSVPALLRLPGLKAEPDEGRIADFLVLHDDLEQTFYRDVFRLPPGHRLCVGSDGVHRTRYFSLELPEQLELADRREYVERFRDLLVQATESRLRSPVDPTIMLSGGLDSSMLAGIVRDSGALAADTALATFSGTFPDYPEIDERDWIAKVLARGSFAPHFHRMDRESPLGRIDRDLVVHGQPFYAPNNYVDSAIMDRAAEAGAGLLLDGLDGDSTVGHGWEFMGQLFREGRWRRLLREARALGKNTDRSAAWFLWRHALVPTWVGWTRRLGVGSSTRVPRLVAPDFAARMDLQARIVASRKAAISTPLSPYRVQHLDKVASSVLPMSYEIAAQQAAARGIVRRHPYYDRRLVEFCLSLPPYLRLWRGADRVIQRRAAEGLVPEDIRRRLTKSIWEQNFRDRLVTEDRAELEQFRPRYGPALEPFVDLNHVSGRIEAVLAGQGGKNDLAQIWSLIVLGKWLS